MEKSHVGTIRAIDKTSIHNICSGQVILNLASAVKELVENSLDAGATSVEIYAKEYGSESIEIIDNGLGVEEKNFEGLTLKHHTSKLSDFGDLTNVETFGFRGEALSSLCALSNMTIVSCHKDASVGARLEYSHDGVLIKHSPTPRQVGTTVILRNLFYTLPVRHKEFQNNLQKEFNKMLQLVTSYCLICTNTRLLCTNQTRKGKSTSLSTAGGSTVKENIACIFGSKQLSSLVEFHMKPLSSCVIEEYALPSSLIQKADAFRIEGYVSSCKHGQGRSSSDRQYFYINSRPFDSTKISRLVNEVYHSYNRHQYPFVFLNIITEKSSLDINVTPDKRQIFIQNEKLLLAIIKSSLEELYEPELSKLQCKKLQDFQNGKNAVIGHFMKRETISDNSDINSVLGKIKRSLTSLPQEEILASKCQRLNNESVCIGSKPNSTAASQSISSDAEEQTSCQKMTCATILVATSQVDPNEEATNNKEFLNTNTASKYNRTETNKRIDIKMFQMYEKGNKNSFKNNFSYLKDKNNRRSLENSMKNNLLSSDMFGRKQEHSLNSRIEERTQNIHSEEVNFTYSDKLMENAEMEQKQMKEKNDATINDQKDTKLFINSDTSIVEVADEAMTRSRKCVVIQFSLEKLKDSTKHEVSAVKETYGIFRRFRAKLTTLENKNAEEELKKEISKDMFAKMKIIGQFNKGFIVTKLGTDLFIIDQHATDEKYNYEIMKENTIMETQKLLCPQDLNLTAVNKCVLLDNLNIFEKNGFSFAGVDDTGSNTAVHLTSVPVSRNWSFGKEDIEEMIFMLNDCPGKMCRPSRMYQMFASRACRTSVMIGTALSYSDMRKLVNHMGDIEHPWNCPHGRPTMRHLFNMALLDDS